MTEEKKTGDAVRDVKKSELPGTTEKKPAPEGKKQVQIHAGNIGVVQTQLMSEMNTNIARIARCLEIMVKEMPSQGKA